MNRNKFFLLSLLILSLTSCIPFGKTYEMYFDKPCCKIGDVDISFSSFSESNYPTPYDYTIYIGLNLINTNPKPLYISISNLEIVRESNNAVYSVTAYIFNPIKLECDIKNSFSLRSTLPKSTKEENYYLTCKYGSQKLIYHLYNMPDEEKENA